MSVLFLVAIFTIAFIQAAFALPSITDNNLKVEPVVDGLFSPTDMAFANGSSILVLEKDGLVRLVSNGNLKEQPLLHLPVFVDENRTTRELVRERGMLGIDITNSSRDNNSQNKDVFFYYTERDPLRNRVYKYQWNGQSLINSRLILDLPAQPGPQHNGGKISIGPDGYLYAVIGDLNRNGQLQNFRAGPPPDNTSVILRVYRQNGSAAPDNPFVDASGNETLNKYYAYGIRNSFGMDFDPLTGYLWDTENAYTTYDEINLVMPGFNSGWEAVMGPISRSNHTEDDLVELPQSFYQDPVFSWKDTVAPTDIEFLNSSALGPKYSNNFFVGDYIGGNLYFFQVNESRDGISLDSRQKESGLSDKVVDNETENFPILFGSGLNGITDIEAGPVGFLYVLSYDDDIIYRIS
jgi:glucose/arabinose dehydrogenase